MSATTRWSRADVVVCAALVAVAAAALPTGVGANHRTVAAPSLPLAVAALVPSLTAQGGAEMTVLGLSIYDGWYWGDGHIWAPERTYLIDLHYHRSLTGVRIAERSVAEIEAIGRGSPSQRLRWGEAMRRIFPDVTKGDRITGVHLPAGVVRFFFNGAPIGDIADAEFARAFFGIWLDPKTSRADFRRQLLGESP
ncbi:MAG: chalcone isomerase family protein [Betaproteobacteria bacterium]